MPGKRSHAAVDSSDGAGMANAKKSKTSHSYSGTQKAAIQDLAVSLQIDKNAAAKLLKGAGWHVNVATRQGLEAQAAAAFSASKAKLDKLFDQYHGDEVDEPDELSFDATLRLMADLEIDLEDVASLVFAELVQSPTLGKVEREKFTDSLANHGVNDLPSMQSIINKRRATLADPKQSATFRPIYKHAFIMARPAGQKSVPLEVAAEYWKALLRAPSLEWKNGGLDWLDRWLEFLDDRAQKHADKDSYRSINKDTWEQTLAFAYKTLEDASLSWWSEDSAWPSVIDEFVEYLKKEQHIGGGAMDTS